MAATGAYRVVATNPASASENRIHADDEARRHGFRGGLVPGVTVYGYAVHPLVDALGPAWIEHGRADVRFRSPCYAGDALTVQTSNENGNVDVEVTCDDGTCVTGTASLGQPAQRAEALEAAAAIPARERPEPDMRPPASEDSLAPGTVLGSIELATDGPALSAYLLKIQEPSHIYGQKGWLHPGMLVEGANWVLSANVVLPLWLHVGTEVQHLRAVPIDEPLRVRARVAQQWEHRGHRFVALDVAWTAGADPVAAARHTAIWHLAGT